PIASAVAVALMSVVTPVHAQQSATGSVDTPKSQTQPDATAAQAAKDKAKDATKPSAAKDAEASADAKTAQGEPQVLAQATTPPPVNGHPIASGDWFVLDQVQTVGRSVSFTLLPSELVSQVIVRKSATADLVEGGVAGNVDIITRRPLDFRKQLTAAASLEAVYADLPKKTDPQISGLINWKNEAGTMGVMVQGFYEKRHLRR